MHNVVTEEETMEQSLPRTLSYPEQLSQIKRGLRRLGVSQPGTMQAFTALAFSVKRRNFGR
jgi:hypothetical protein